MRIESGYLFTKLRARVLAASLVVGVALGFLLRCVLDDAVPATRFVEHVAAVSVSDESSCARSAKESDGFYCESDDVWRQRVEIVRRQAAKQCGYEMECCDGSQKKRWYMDCFEPEWSCADERLGPRGRGGRWICDVELLSVSKRCLVYTIFHDGARPPGAWDSPIGTELRSNSDLGFEKALKKRAANCEFVVLDSTNIVDREHPRSVIQHIKPWTLRTRKADNSSIVLPSEPPTSMNVNSGVTLSLQEAMRRLKHSGRKIDVFRVDASGLEYDMLEHLLEDETDPPIRQLLLTVYVANRNARLFALLRRRGFVITHKETDYESHDQIHQYVFLRLANDFFRSENVDDPVVRQLDSHGMMSTYTNLQTTSAPTEKRRRRRTNSGSGMSRSHVKASMAGGRAP
eukprot:CAMPEP_0185834266 /NCGR_PEP_ID=MMETSP1353-20130828/4923_1 /TAXON_ID=1077150 /ORGANISM="Erythrolobus australicus, Strain CCMP3124" /LENGTH=401 /DNA_ID=CAMNT_0028532671 /DNA_START=63 /DNA_END=1268 /DNA_ORIENTATION=-